MVETKLPETELPKPPKSFQIYSKIELNSADFVERSTFFARALSNPALTHNEPDQVEAVEIPDTDLDTLQHYLRVALENDATVVLPANPKARVHEDEEERQRQEQDAILMQLCKVYYLATKLGDSMAVNLIIDKLIQYCFQTNRMLVDKHVNRIVETLSDKCGLYKLAVDMWAFGAKHSNFKVRADLGKLPLRFVKDVLLRKIKAEGDSGEEVVDDAFSCDLIADVKEAYRGLYEVGGMEDEEDGDGSDFASDDDKIMDSDDEKSLVPDSEVADVVAAELALHPEEEEVEDAVGCSCIGCMLDAASSGTEGSMEI